MNSRTFQFPPAFRSVIASSTSAWVTFSSSLSRNLSRPARADMTQYVISQRLVPHPGRIMHRYQQEPGIICNKQLLPQLYDCYNSALLQICKFFEPDIEIT